MKKYIQKHPYVCLCVLIFITGLIIYYPFIFGKYIFAYADWGYDSKHAFIPFYEYYAQKISNLRLDNYDFSYGLGTSVYANIFNLLDPFCGANAFLGSIIGANKIGLLLIYVHLLKNVVIGCLGLYYLRLFKFSNVTCILSSYVLSFCGYMMVTGQHYQFSSYAVIYMFTVVMCEKTIRNPKWYVGLIVSVAVQGLLGPYATFQALIAAGLYCIIRVFQRDEELRFKDKIVKLAKLAGEMLVGLMISMFAFLPQSYEILYVSHRLSSEKSMLDLIIESFSIVSSEYIESGFFRLFSNNMQGLINTWEGPSIYFSTTPYFFSLFFPLCITQQMTKIVDGSYKKRTRIIRVIVLLLMISIFCVNFFPAMSNMFAYIAYRFIFVLLPVFVFCFAETLEELFYKKKYNLITCATTTTVALVLLFILFKSQNEYSIMSLKVTIVTFVIIAFASVGVKIAENKRNIMCAKGILSIAIVFSLLFDAAIGLYVDRSIVTKEDYTTNYQMPYLHEFEKIISVNENDSFVRIDRTFLGYDGSPDILCSFICPTRSVSDYNSTLSKYTVEFIQDLMGKKATTQIGYALNSYGTWYDTHVADLIGLKYVVSQENEERDGWNLIAEYGGYYLYQKETMGSAGLLYDNYITMGEYEELDEASKQVVTKQAVILDDEVEGIAKKTEYNYEVIATDLEKGLNNQSLEETEGENQSLQRELVLEQHVMQEQGFLKFRYSGGGKYILLDEQRRVLDTGEIQYSDKIKEKVISIISEIKYVVLEIDSDQELEIEDMELCSMSKEYSNDVQFNNPDMGNVVEGKVTTSEEKILYMPITYDSNWKAYVNGEQVKIMRANYGFVAVAIPTGESTVKFVYCNYALYIGIVISILGVIIGIIITFWQKKSSL